jgi:hypothetical protein
MATIVPILKAAEKHARFLSALTSAVRGFEDFQVGIAREQARLQQWAGVFENHVARAVSWTAALNTELDRYERLRASMIPDAPPPKIRAVYLPWMRSFDVPAVSQRLPKRTIVRPEVRRRIGF